MAPTRTCSPRLAVDATRTSRPRIPPRTRAASHARRATSLTSSCPRTPSQCVPGVMRVRCRSSPPMPVMEPVPPATDRLLPTLRLEPPRAPRAMPRNRRVLSPAMHDASSVTTRTGACPLRPAEHATRPKPRALMRRSRGVARRVIDRTALEAPRRPLHVSPAMTVQAYRRCTPPAVTPNACAAMPRPTPPLAATGPLARAPVIWTGGTISLRPQCALDVTCFAGSVSNRTTDWDEAAHDDRNGRDTKSTRRAVNAKSASSRHLFTGPPDSLAPALRPGTSV